MPLTGCRNKLAPAPNQNYLLSSAESGESQPRRQPIGGQSRSFQPLRQSLRSQCGQMLTKHVRRAKTTEIRLMSAIPTLPHHARPQGAVHLPTPGAQPASALRANSAGVLVTPEVTSCVTTVTQPFDDRSGQRFGWAGSLLNQCVNWHFMP